MSSFISRFVLLFDLATTLSRTSAKHQLVRTPKVLMTTPSVHYGIADGAAGLQGLPVTTPTVYLVFCRNLAREYVDNGTLDRNHFPNRRKEGMFPPRSITLFRSPKPPPASAWHRHKCPEQCYVQYSSARHILRRPSRSINRIVCTHRPS